MKKYLLPAAFVIFQSIFFTSCYDAIFHGIREEIPLEEAGIQGYINSIVRFKNEEKEYLFVQNGRIYYKELEQKEHGAWKLVPNTPEGLKYSYIDTSFSGVHFYKLAADEKYIYALGYTPHQDGEKGKNIPKTLTLYACSGIGKEWKKVDSVNKMLEKYINNLDENNYMTDISAALFCTNSFNTNERKAYIRIGGGGQSGKANESYGKNGGSGILKLNGIDEPELITEGTNGAGLNTVCALFFRGDVFFFDTPAACNENYVYYASGQDIYYSKIQNYVPSNKEKITSGVSKDIISLAACKNALIAGTEGGGSYHFSLENGLPKITAFPTNAGTIMISPYIIRMLFCEKPSAEEEQCSWYGAMDFKYSAKTSRADYKNRGLWSYYPSRKTWNRE